MYDPQSRLSIRSDCLYPVSGRGETLSPFQQQMNDAMGTFYVLRCRLVFTGLGMRRPGWLLPSGGVGEDRCVQCSEFRGITMY